MTADGRLVKRFEYIDSVPRNPKPHSLHIRVDMVANPTPHTLHPTPYIPHLSPYTLHPTPFTEPRVE